MCVILWCGWLSGVCVYVCACVTVWCVYITHTLHQTTAVQWLSRGDFCFSHMVTSWASLPGICGNSSNCHHSCVCMVAHVSVCTCVHTVHMCMCVLACLCTHARVDICTYIYMCTCYVSTYVHMCGWMCVQGCIYGGRGKEGIHPNPPLVIILPLPPSPLKYCIISIIVLPLPLTSCIAHLNF